MARPTTLEPNRTAAFNLTDRQLAWIKEQAEKRGVSMAAVVREAVEIAAQAEKQDEEAA